MSGLHLKLALGHRQELHLRHRIALRTEFAKILEVSQDELANRVEKELESNLMLMREHVSPGVRNADFENWQDYRVNSISKPDSLQAVLLRQLRAQELDERMHDIGETLIANIGGDGYLKASCAEIACELQAPTSEVEEVLGCIQQLEPVGVGARTVKECLCIQIARGQFHDSVELYTLVRKHLVSLADRDLEGIAESMGVTVRHVKNLWDKLRELNPRPGREYGAENVPTIIPDVIVENEDGGHVLFLANDVAQGLHINHEYPTRSGHSPTDKQWAREIAKKRQAAQQFMDLIELRSQTILGVARAIIALQPDFIEKGPGALTPMKLKDVADLLGVHPSTVSRATRSCYLQTPRGIFEMRTLFASGIATTTGEEVSVNSVQAQIRALIDTEDRLSPLSDQTIQSNLLSHGISIERRTVAKYRNGMRIPSSRERGKVHAA